MSRIHGKQLEKHAISHKVKLDSKEEEKKKKKLINLTKKKEIKIANKQKDKK